MRYQALIIMNLPPPRRRRTVDWRLSFFSSSWQDGFTFSLVVSSATVPPAAAFVLVRLLAVPPFQQVQLPHRAIRTNPLCQFRYRDNVFLLLLLLFASLPFLRHHHISLETIEHRLFVVDDDAFSHPSPLSIFLITIPILVASRRGKTSSLPSCRRSCLSPSFPPARRRSYAPDLLRCCCVDDKFCCFCCCCCCCC